MKRFYREAAAVRGVDGWHVALDGRQVKTQGGHVLVLPNEGTARLLAFPQRLVGMGAVA